MNLSDSLKIFPAFLLSFLLVSGLALAANCQTKGDYKVCFYEKYNGISHHIWNISIEDLSGPPPSSVNISTLIDSTNFPASKIHDAKLYSRENVTYTVPIFNHYDYVNGTLHDNGTVEDYNATHLNYTTGSNQTFVRKHRSPGAYDWSAADNWWTENETDPVYKDEQRWEWRWQRAKEQYFKRNAERFTQGMGIFAVPPNPKWFRYEFDTPVQFWSKGRFALNVNDVQFDPWWNSTWKYRRDVTFTEQSGNDLTHYPMESTLYLEDTHVQTDCDDVRPIAPNGNEIEFNSTCNSGYNTTHTQVNLTYKINVSASSTVDYSIYYDNPDAAQSAKEVNYSEAKYNFYDYFQRTSLDRNYEGDTTGFSIVGNTTLKDEDAGAGNTLLMDVGHMGTWMARWDVMEDSTSTSRDWMYEVDNTTGHGFKYDLTQYGLSNSTDWVDTGNDYLQDVWYSQRVIFNGTHVKGRMWDMGTSEPSTWDKVIPETETAGTYIKFSDNEGGAITHIAYADNITLRKYVEPEPTYTVGPEHNQPQDKENIDW